MHTPNEETSRPRVRRCRLECRMSAALAHAMRGRRTRPLAHVARSRFELVAAKYIFIYVHSHPHPLPSTFAPLPVLHPSAMHFQASRDECRAAVIATMDAASRLAHRGGTLSARIGGHVRRSCPPSVVGRLGKVGREPRTLDVPAAFGLQPAPCPALALGQ